MYPIRPGRASVGQGEKALLVLVTLCFVVVPATADPLARKKSSGWVIAGLLNAGCCCHLYSGRRRPLVGDALHCRKRLDERGGGTSPLLENRVPYPGGNTKRKRPRNGEICRAPDRLRGLCAAKVAERSSLGFGKRRRLTTRAARGCGLSSNPANVYLVLPAPVGRASKNASVTVKGYGSDRRKHCPLAHIPKQHQPLPPAT